MARNHVIKPYYSSFRGINLSGDDITRDPRFATTADNVKIDDRGSIVKRKGYKYHHEKGEYAMMAFPNVDATTGVITPELLLYDGTTLSKETTGTLNITNSIGTGQPLSVDIKGDATTNNFQVILTFSETIDDNGDTVQAESTTTLNLGDVTEEASAYTMASLATAISAITGLSATVTGTDTVSAVSLKLTEFTQISDGSSGSLDFLYTTDITSDSGATMTTGFADFRDNDTGEPLSNTIFNRSLYMANGFDDMLQYDGHTLFRAGMTQHAQPSAATGAAGSLSSTYTYKIQSVFIDHNNLEHQGAISEASASVAPTSETVDVTVSNVEDGNGFDARGAFADGNQNNATSGGSVTLTVDDSAGGAHTVIAGDVIYLFNRDAATNDYAEYTVTSVTPTTIVVTSSVDIDLNDNDVISTGLRQRIYRNKAGGTEYFLVAEIPNDPFNANQTYNDNITDANLGARYVDPVRTPALPPKARYLTTYKNTLILAHERTDPNKVWHSEPDDPTNFPVLNNFSVEAPTGGTISAVSEANEALVIFKRDPESIFTMTGDLVNRRIRVDQLSSSIGCQGHASVQDINGVLFFLSNRGVYSMVGAGIPQLRSDSIDQTLTETQRDDTKVLRKRRAQAAHNPLEKEYVLFIPAEDTLSGNRYANNNSTMFVYDYLKDNWVQWTNINARNGVVFFDDTLFWTSRQLDRLDTSVASYVFRRHNEGYASDYGDQTTAIPFRYASGWESLGQPSVYKKFLRFGMHSLGEVEEDVTVEDFTVDVSTEINYAFDRPHSNFTASFPDRGQPWDTKAWDFFTWGGFQQPAYRTKLRSGKAQSMRVVLENEEYEKNLIITGWELEIALPQTTTIKE